MSLDTERRRNNWHELIIGLRIEVSSVKLTDAKIASFAWSKSLGNQ